MSFSTASTNNPSYQFRQKLYNLNWELTKEVTTLPVFNNLNYRIVISENWAEFKDYPSYNYLWDEFIPYCKL